MKFIFVKQVNYTIILSVILSKLQVTILARSSREMSQTVDIDWQQFLSRVRVSVRPTHFLYTKNTQNYREYQVASATVYLNEAVTTDRPLIAELAKRGVNSVTVGRHRTATTWTATAEWARVCVRDVFAIYDNNIWPRLE